MNKQFCGPPLPTSRQQEILQKSAAYRAALLQSRRVVKDGLQAESLIRAGLALASSHAKTRISGRPQNEKSHQERPSLTLDLLMQLRRSEFLAPALAAGIGTVGGYVLLRGVLQRVLK